MASHHTAKGMDLVALGRDRNRQSPHTAEALFLLGACRRFYRMLSIPGRYARGGRKACLPVCAEVCGLEDGIEKFFPACGQKFL